MRVLNVNSTLGLRTGGGTAERTFQMSRHLAKRGVDTTVLTLDIELDEARKQAVAPAVVIALPCLWRRFYLPRGGFGVIRKLVNEADVIHLMGHWGLLSVLVYFAARLAGKPYVFCPAGSLSLFGRSMLLKRIYNFLVGNRIVRNASAWIAVTPSEFPHFESYGVPASRVTVIPNGISKDDFPVVDTKSFMHSRGLPEQPIILFMGRLNPIKGPDLLLQAFVSVQSHIPDYQLVFAGPDEGMRDSLIDHARQASISDRVHFLGFVSGLEKSAAYHMARLLVVSSRQEAMSIVALEAGICGTPVLLTDQCGFNELRMIDPYLVAPASVEGIATSLEQLLNRRDSLDNISSAIEKFVSEKYSWDHIVEMYLNLYGSNLNIK